MFKKTLLAAAAVAFGGFVATASAATSAQFQVKITITSACSVTAGSGSDINFGNVPANTPVGDPSLNGTSNISVTCSKTTPYIVGLQTTDGSAGTGHMSGSTGDLVPYSLFQDSGHTKVWGNTGTAVGTAGNDYVSNGAGGLGNGTGSAQTIPVYAVVTNPNFTPGSYADTVTVNVLF